MSQVSNDRPGEGLKASDPSPERRAALRRLGRFAVVTAPAVTLLLAAGSKSAKAQPCSPCSSSRQFKIADGVVDAEAIIGGLAGLTVERWRYKPEAGLDQRDHIGPGAEEFRAAFGLGDGVTISPIDAIGVCLAAIQALSAKLDALEEERLIPERKIAA